MADNESIDGLDLILRKLTALETKASGRVLATIIRAQLNVIGKQMKADTDSKVKEGRKGVRSRFKNNTRTNWIQAKVGFGVGKTKKTAIKPRTSKRSSRGGVGIATQNIHWWVAGTHERFTGGKTRRGTSKKRGAWKTFKANGKSIMNRGTMPSMQPGLAAIAATKSRGKQNAEMIKRGALALQKEVLKIQNMR